MIVPQPPIVDETPPELAHAFHLQVFDPVQVEDGKTKHSFIDGGLVANNPEFFGITEALMKRYQKHQDIYLVSLGTGKIKRPRDHQSILKWTKLDWGKNLISTLFSSSSEANRYYSDTFLKPHQQLRIQFDILNEDNMQIISFTLNLFHQNPK